MVPLDPTCPVYSTRHPPGGISNNRQLCIISENYLSNYLKTFIAPHSNFFPWTVFLPVWWDFT